MIDHNLFFLSKRYRQTLAVTQLDSCTEALSDYFPTFEFSIDESIYHHTYKKRLSLVSPRWMLSGPPKSEMVIDLNGNGTITCNVTADPLPKFSWYRDGQPILQPTWVIYYSTSPKQLILDTHQLIRLLSQCRNRLCKHWVWRKLNLGTTQVYWGWR